MTYRLIPLRLRLFPGGEVIIILVGAAPFRRHSAGPVVGLPDGVENLVEILELGRALGLWQSRATLELSAVVGGEELVEVSWFVADTRNKFFSVRVETRDKIRNVWVKSAVNRHTLERVGVEREREREREREKEGNTRFVFWLIGE